MKPARRTKSYAAAELQDADGVKTSFATSTDPVALTEADWNGAVLNASATLDLPRTITISRSAAANQYSTDPIVLTGTRGGRTVTESLVPANDDGNDILRGTQAFDALTSVSIPAQAGTGGAFTIGVQDICAPYGDRFGGVQLHADGTLNVQYGEEASATTDAIPFTVATRDFAEIAASRILTSAALSPATDVGLTLYIP